jgi:hypothetical protein
MANQNEKKFKDVSSFVGFLIGLFGEDSLKEIKMDVSDVFPDTVNKVSVCVPIEDEDGYDYISVKIFSTVNDEYVVFTTNKYIDEISKIVQSIKYNVLSYQSVDDSEDVDA